jgi:DNA replication protein DnaC
VPLDEQTFDEHSRAEQEGFTPLEFLARLVGQQADRRREQAIERRIRLRFGRLHPGRIDWQFNAQTIDRGQIGSCACDSPQGNLVLVGRSGLGKSRIITDRPPACVLATVRYTTSGRYSPTTAH